MQEKWNRRLWNEMEEDFVWKEQSAGVSDLLITLYF